MDKKQSSNVLKTIIEWVRRYPAIVCILLLFVVYTAMWLFSARVVFPVLTTSQCKNKGGVVEYGIGPTLQWNICVFRDSDSRQPIWLFR